MENQLINSIILGDLSELKRLHKEENLDITIYDNKALILATTFGHLDMIKYLVENGANIKVQNNIVLNEAVRKGRLDIIKYLMEQGIDITVDDNKALYWAASYNHAEIVKYLLENSATTTNEDIILRIKRLGFDLEYYKVPLPDVKVAE